MHGNVRDSASQDIFPKLNAETPPTHVPIEGDSENPPARRMAFQPGEAAGRVNYLDWPTGTIHIGLRSVFR
jgi:hypothetical protein